MSSGPLTVSVHALDLGQGEGVVADAAVFAELDCKAACVATAVLAPEPLPLETVARQLEATERRAPVAAVRIGFIAGERQVDVVAGFVRRVAPATTVFGWSSQPGASVPVDAPTLEAVRRHLYPVARVVVIRAIEASVFSGREVEDLEGLRDAARRLRDQGAKAVLIAGLLVRDRVLDLLDDDGTVALFDTSRIQASRIPGLAGAHAAALAAHLARGLVLSHAAEAAQRYIGFRLMRGR